LNGSGAATAHDVHQTPQKRRFVPKTPEARIKKARSLDEEMPKCFEIEQSKPAVSPERTRFWIGWRRRPSDAQSAVPSDGCLNRSFALVRPNQPRVSRHVGGEEGAGFEPSIPLHDRGRIVVWSPIGADRDPTLQSNSTPIKDLFAPHVRRALDEAGCRAKIDVAEMDNYPYSCWRLSPTRIRPIVRKRWLQIATFPGNRIGAVFSRVSPLFPQAVAAPNILCTGFTNANAMLHVANCVANAGRIENGDVYKFYAEGVTPAVARLYEEINAERVAVAAALGASVPTLADWFERVYGVRGATLVETCQRLTYNSDGPYQATGTPKSLDHKFITEDVPTGLVPMSALGAAAGVGTPAINALIEIVRSMTAKDFAAEGRTLERLGLSGMDAPRIRCVVEEGFSTH
jgi:hypothetical protein